MMMRRRRRRNCNELDGALRASAPDDSREVTKYVDPSTGEESWLYMNDQKIELQQI